MRCSWRSSSPCCQDWDWTGLGPETGMSDWKSGNEALWTRDSGEACLMMEVLGIRSVEKTGEFEGFQGFPREGTKKRKSCHHEESKSERCRLSSLFAYLALALVLLVLPSLKFINVDVARARSTNSQQLSSSFFIHLHLLPLLLVANPNTPESSLQSF